tara:strand:+ start:2145 stop:2516 length:372 start_codon:yes stop_codon:yes gene_type:complete
MPVYLDDKDAIQETVKKYLQGVNCSVAEFMAYIYMDKQGLYLIDDSSNEYDELIEKVKAEHPSQSDITIVDEITEVMEVQEREYIRGWMDQAIKMDNLRKSIRGEFVENLEKECQTGDLSISC